MAPTTVSRCCRRRERLRAIGRIAIPEDAFDLQRFLDAQDRVYDTARSELAQGRKTSHWIWFIFPQMFGLGRSATSKKYGIRSREEALAYLEHPILGPRLLECTTLVNRSKDASIRDVLGSPDDLKFHSSMTLFQEVSGRTEFANALEQFFGGVADKATLTLLRG